LTRSLKGDAKAKFKKLINPVLKDPDVAKEVDAQSSLDRILKKDAKLNGPASSIQALIKRYKKMIEDHPGTLASEAAKARVTELEALLN